MLTGNGELHHMSSITVSTPAFPRAQLGLPIVFQFSPNSPRDKANDCEAIPAGHGESNRMASPLILRPLGLQGGGAVAMVVQLQAEKPRGVKLSKLKAPAGTSAIRPVSEIEDPVLRSYPHSPLSASANGSAIEAFLAFARTRL
jgi:CRISPR-associated protein Cmr1